MSETPYTARNRRGEFCRTLAGAERDREACLMQARGKSLEEISDALGYGSRSNARRAINTAIADTVAEGAEELRAVQMLQIRLATEKIMEALGRPHYAHSQSGVLMLDPDGSHTRDFAPVYAAIDRLVKLQKRLAELNPGLEPATGGISDDALDAEYRRLIEAYGEPGA